MTASPNTMTALDAAAKQLYKDGNFEEVVYKSRPLLGMLPKFEGFGGRNMPVVLLYGNTQAVSYDFSTAQTASVDAYAGKLSVDDFLLTRSRSYSLFTLDGETIEALRGDNAGFITSLKAVMDAAVRALSDEVETSLFRDRSGAICDVKTVSASTGRTFTVENDESSLFEIGMRLVAAADKTGGDPLNSAKVLVVTGVNRANGTISMGVDSTGATVDVDDNSTGWTTAFVAGAYVFRVGDYTASAITNKLAGLDSWNPESAPSASESYFGVDRSVDSRLWGVPYDGSLDSVEDALIEGQSICAREGGEIDAFVMHNLQYRKLVKQLGSKRQYVQMNARSAEGIYANIGYRGVMVDGDMGPISIIAANKCPLDRAHGLSLKSWLLATLGPTVHFTEYDSLRILRQSGDDGIEGRLVFRGNLACRAPIWNSRVKLAV